MAANKNVKKI